MAVPINTINMQSDISEFEYGRGLYYQLDEDIIAQPGGK